MPWKEPNDDQHLPDGYEYVTKENAKSRGITDWQRRFLGKVDRLNNKRNFLAIRRKGDGVISICDYPAGAINITIWTNDKVDIYQGNKFKYEDCEAERRNT